ncbi:MAG: hypothetical protein NTZ56_21675 [Acidobacteria bacterium]|nr:hypothetical protein [Acidobacteriota bacterium]
MRTCLVGVLLSGFLYAQTPPAPVAPKGKAAVASSKPSGAKAPADEPALRARVLQFYGLVREGKLLAAVEFVEKDSRDFFLAGDKQKPDDLEIDKLEWLEGGTQARVWLTGKTWMMVGAQKAQSRFQFESYWRRHGRQWLYFDPPFRERRTPFGVVKLTRSGEVVGGSVDLKAKVSSGASVASVAALATAIEVNAKNVEFSRSNAGSAEFTVKNGAEGYINVIFGGTVLKGLEFLPATASVPPGQTATFTLKWTPGEQPQHGNDWGAVIIQPLERRTEFKIRWVD